MRTLKLLAACGGGVGGAPHLHVLFGDDVFFGCGDAIRFRNLEPNNYQEVENFSS